MLAFRTTAAAVVLLLASAFLIHSPHTIFNMADRNQDFDQHYAWAVQFAEGLRSGDPYPRWMPLGNQGLGEPALLFYSPLFYYCSALASVFTSSIWAAMRVVEVLSTFVVGLLAWRMFAVRAGARPSVALSMALACQATPMLFMLFHYFNGFPWAANGACLMALLYCLQPREEGAGAAVLNVGAAMSVAALVLMHIVSALMVLICVSVAVLVHTDGGRIRVRLWTPQVFSWGLSAGLGLALSSVYVVPALASTNYIASEVWTRDYTPFNAFSFPTITHWLYGMRWFSFQWPVSVFYLVIVVGAVYLLRKHSGRPENHPWRWAISLSAICVTALFLCSELSFPLWNVQTPLRKVQFPHRFLFVLSVAAPIALGMAAIGLDSTRRTKPGRTMPAVTVVVTALLFTIALAGKIVFRDGERLNLVDTDLAPYGSYTEYTLRGQTAEAMRFLPERRFEKALAEHSARADGERRGASYSWRIESPSAYRATLPVLWFPAWSARVGSSDVEVRADPATGLVQVEIPAGASRVDLVWRRLPAETLGVSISAVALLLIAAASLVQRLRRA